VTDEGSDIKNYMLHVTCNKLDGVRQALTIENIIGEIIFV